MSDEPAGEKEQNVNLESQPLKRRRRNGPAPVKNRRALTVVRDRIRARWSELPADFSTLDVVEFFDRSEREMARSCANLALRSMERQGRVECLGRGARNACSWAKRAPAEDPTGVAAPVAVRYLAQLAEVLPEGDPLQHSCRILAGKICDRFGVEPPQGKEIL